MKRTRYGTALILSAALFVIAGLASGETAVAGEYVYVYPAPTHTTPVYPAPTYYYPESPTYYSAPSYPTPPVHVYPNGRKDYNPYYQRKYKDDLPGLVDAINRDYPPFRSGRPGGW